MAVILGGSGIDAEVVVGPNIATDGLLFYIDPADTTSLVTAGNIPLVEAAEIDKVYSIIGTGSLDVDSSTFVVPKYYPSNNGILFTGDGTNNGRLNFTPDINIGTTGTIDIWVKPVAGGGRWLYGRIVGGTTTYLLSVTLVTTTLTITADSNNYNSIGISLSNNQWYNISMVFNGVNSKLYINGQEHISTSGATNTWWRGSTIPNYTIIVLGNETSAASSGDGYLGPLRLYNKNLSSQEVLQNYNAMKNRYTI